MPARTTTRHFRHVTIMAVVKPQVTAQIGVLEPHKVRPSGQVEEAFREWQELGSKCVVVEVEGQGVHGCPADRCDDHRRPNGSVWSRLVSQE